MRTLKKYNLFLIIPLALLAVFLYPHAAHAGLVSFAYNGIVEALAGVLFNFVLTPLTWFLAWAGMLVNYAIQPGNMPIITSKFVTTGWGVMRDLTNMLFILIMLAIALDYILFNSVGVKRALPRLLLVALLINFSLPIAGVVLDFANVFTDFFIKQVGNGINFTETLASKFGLANIFDAKSVAQATSPEASINGAVTTTVFSIFFVLGTTFAFLALAIMFFIRYFYISILLIVLPLVLVTSILPQLSSHYRSWSKKFISWTMFAPAAAFFLYLSALFLDTGIQTFNSGMTGFVSETAKQVTTFVVAWMLMLMSLTTAQSMGVTGANVAVSTFNSATRWAKGRASAGGAAVGRRLGREASTAAGKFIQPEKLSGRLADTLASSRFGGGLSRVIRSAGIKAEGAMVKKPAQLTNEEKAKYTSYSGRDLLKEAESLASDKFSPVNRAKAVALYEMAANKGTLNILKDDGTVNESATTDLIKRAYATAKTHGNKGAMETFMKSNPIAYDEIAQEEWEKMEREGKLADTDHDYSAGVKRLSKGRRRDTGETYEDAKNKAFKKMGSADFENLKGMWNEKSTKAFLMSGVMGTNHIRMANTANDTEFINLLSSELNKLTEKEILELRKKSPSLVTPLANTGNNVDFLAIEPFRVKYNAIMRGEKKEGPRETKQSWADEEDRHL